MVLVVGYARFWDKMFRSSMEIALDTRISSCEFTRANQIYQGTECYAPDVTGLQVAGGGALAGRRVHL